MKKNISARIATRFRVIARKIADTFRQERTRELFTFLGFVLLSLVFWFMQGLNEEVESSFKIPVELQNLPEKTTLINDLPTHVEVRIRDKGPVMLGYAIEGLNPLRINFQEYDKGGSSFFLALPQLETILRKSLRPTTTILSVIPDTLKVQYTHNAGKRVKLVVRGKASTTPQCVLSGPMTAEIDSVMVYGDHALLKHLKEVYTTEFEAKRLSDTLRTTVRIARIPNLRIVPDQVMVTIPVEEITSKLLDIPIVTQSVPAGWSLITFPSSVQLSCMMPFSKFASVNEESFLLGVDFTDLSGRTPPAKLGIKVLKAPDFVRNIVLSRDSVDYIVEHKRSAFDLQADTAIVSRPDTI
ncbi:hypothetical protein [Barnesiella viscericola]|uniref:YbbR-like domain-containing protein n=1 Tax=Barnesiella viscericola TaxID=397865 RepID=A0A921MQ22_9BACT|nr:hypothetical protein [Barnesiella viscericola]HJG88425.1 hypothetical protein [Barnesiella viscericola]